MEVDIVITPKPIIVFNDKDYVFFSYKGMKYRLLVTDNIMKDMNFVCVKLNPSLLPLKEEIFRTLTKLSLPWPYDDDTDLITKSTKLSQVDRQLGYINYSNRINQFVNDFYLNCYTNSTQSLVPIELNRDYKLWGYSGVTFDRKVDPPIGRVETIVFSGVTLDQRLAQNRRLKVSFTITLKSALIFDDTCVVHAGYRKPWTFATIHECNPSNTFTLTFDGVGSSSSGSLDLLEGADGVLLWVSCLLISRIPEIEWVNSLTEFFSYDSLILEYI